MALARNIGLNLIGQGAPLLAAAFCIPMLIQHLGTDRFGVLTIAWMVIGYFSLFDLGLGRALTHAISEKLARHEEAYIPAVAWTSMALMTVLGLIAGVAIVLGRDAMVTHVLKVPEVYREETIASFVLLGAAVPLVIVTTGLRGILEAYQRFDLVNIVRIPMGVLTFAGPLLVVPWSVRLDAVVAVLVAGRFLTMLWHAVLVDRAVPAIRRHVHFDAAQVRPLLRFGGWMTVSNVISPLMLYMDRFFISAIVGLGAVVYYTTPYEAVYRISVIPEAVFGVLFPLMTAQLAANRDAGDELFATGIKIMAGVMFPAILTMVMLAGPFLAWWLDARFVEHSTLVTQLLAIGIFVNSMARVPYNLIQAAGRADLTGKAHMLEFPLYVGALVLGLHAFGIEGAAAVWGLRMALDLGLLTIIAKRSVKLRHTGRSMLLVAVLTVCLLLATQFQGGLWATLGCNAVVVLAYLGVFYRWILAQPERDRLRQALGQRFAPRRV